MNRIAILDGMEDKMGGFQSLQEAINYWLMENKGIEVTHRETALVQRHSAIMMVVTIFYRDPTISEEPLFVGKGIIKKA